MLDNKDQQHISNVENSALNQAGRDIIINNNGVSVTDVLTIVSDVVADKLKIYQQQAEMKAEQRLDEFKKSLEKELQSKAKDRLDCFNQPSVQVATRNAILGYIQSGDPNKKESLIDLLIERVNVEEGTTKQHLIDKAIMVLPTLSSECLNLLSFMGYTSLSFSGSIVEYEKWVRCIDSIINALGKVSSLDIDFLNQADCSYNVIGFKGNDFIEGQMKACDLLFRHPPSTEFVKQLLEKYNIKKDGNGSFSFNDKTIQWIGLFWDIFDFSDDYTMRVKKNNFSHVRDLLIKSGQSEIAEDLRLYYDATKPFTREEVEMYYIDINPSWKDVFELLKRSDVDTLRLKPVGKYIACRMLSRIGGTDIKLEIFYKDAEI